MQHNTMPLQTPYLLDKGSLWHMDQEARGLTQNWTDEHRNIMQDHRRRTLALLMEKFSDMSLVSRDPSGKVSAETHVEQVVDVDLSEVAGTNVHVVRDTLTDAYKQREAGNSTTTTATLLHNTPQTNITDNIDTQISPTFPANPDENVRQYAGAVMQHTGEVEMTSDRTLQYVLAKNAAKEKQREKQMENAAKKKNSAADEYTHGRSLVPSIRESIRTNENISVGNWRKWLQSEVVHLNNFLRVNRETPQLTQLRADLETVAALKRGEFKIAALTIFNKLHPEPMTSADQTTSIENTSTSAHVNNVQSDTASDTDDGMCMLHDNAM